MALPFGGAFLPLIGGAIDAAASIFGFKSTQDQQKEFAQNSIQWRVEDAKKAGIHPLYALGAPTMSPAAAQVMTGFESAGANTSRALAATSTAEEKALNMALAKVQLQNAIAQGDFIKAQTAAINADTIKNSGPSMPNVIGMPGFIPGQGDAGAIETAPRPVQPQPRAAPILGFDWQINPNTMSAQEWEDIYGDSEVSQTAFMIMKGLNDIQWNIRRMPAGVSPFGEESKLVITDEAMAKARKVLDDLIRMVR